MSGETQSGRERIPDIFFEGFDAAAKSVLANVDVSESFNGETNRTSFERTKTWTTSEGKATLIQFLITDNPDHGMRNYQFVHYKSDGSKKDDECEVGTERIAMYMIHPRESVLFAETSAGTFSPNSDELEKMFEILDSATSSQ